MIYTQETLDELWQTICILNERNERALSPHERRTRDILEDLFVEIGHAPERAI